MINTDFSYSRISTQVILIFQREVEAASFSLRRYRIPSALQQADMKAFLSLVLALALTSQALGFVGNSAPRKFSAQKHALIQTHHNMRMPNNDACDEIINDSADDSRSNVEVPASRRNFLGKAATAAATALIAATPAANAVERAVGAAESKCRQEGNCLEQGDWDGAVGWNWGGRDRCDATDPLCGPDGKLRDAPLAGAPVPDVMGQDITDVVALKLKIGRGDEVVMRIGLYGKACPASIAQFLALCTSDRIGGLATTSKLLFEEGYGAYSAPVSLGRGGLLTTLYPNQRLDFGIPSQAASYAKSRNQAKAGDGFLPQPRPTAQDADIIAKEGMVRKHDVAGLISLPAKGIGYGGTGFESEDEAYASSFQITATAMPSMDKEGRRVVGQLMDAESMAALARIASLPTNKGLKGIVPGQNYGPPLTAVKVLECSTASTSGSGNAAGSEASE